MRTRGCREEVDMSSSATVNILVAEFRTIVRCTRTGSHYAAYDRRRKLLKIRNTIGNIKCVIAIKCIGFGLYHKTVNSKNRTIMRC